MYAGEAYSSAIQNAIRLPHAASSPEPDVSWVVKRNYSRGKPGPTDILLIIEVADSSLPEDTGEKAVLYAGAGIRDYWVVNLRDQTIEVRRDPGRMGIRFRQSFPATTNCGRWPARRPCSSRRRSGRRFPKARKSRSVACGVRWLATAFQHGWLAVKVRPRCPPGAKGSKWLVVPWVSRNAVQNRKNSRIKSCIPGIVLSGGTRPESSATRVHF